jgi:hypothetical protein
MGRIKWLLPLILLCAGTARASDPLPFNFCGDSLPNSISATGHCIFNNVTSGDVLFIHWSAAAGGSGTVVATFTLTPNTETIVCDSGALASHIFGGGNTEAVQTCYIILSASHATLDVSLTITTSGSGPQLHSISGDEVAGLGSFIVGAKNDNGTSLSITTTGTNAYITSNCADAADNIVASGTGNMNLQTYGPNNPTSGTDWRGASGFRIVSSAAAYTMACTFTSGAGLNQISAVAFAIATPPPLAAVYVRQGCFYAGNNGSSSHQGGCTIANNLAGSKGVWGFTSRGPTLQSTNISAINTADTVVCPANAFLTHNYGGQDYTTNICYADLAGANASVQASISYNACAGCRTIDFVFYEVVGANSSADSSSASACAATTCAFTTATANQFTFAFLTDTIGGTVLSPGNSFNQGTYVYGDFGAVEASIAATQITTASGSNTASFSGSTTTPLISVLSFGTPIVSTVKHRSSIL